VINLNKISGWDATADLGLRLNDTSGTTTVVTSNEVRNYPAAGGAGMYLFTGSYTVSNNTIVKNLNGLRAGSGTITAKNNIISNKPDGTTWDANSKGVYKDNGTFTVNSTYDDVWNNQTNYYSAGGSAIVTGVGTISANPLFISPAGDDFHLQAASPCRGAGTPEGTDMGCYPTDTIGPTITVDAPAGGEKWRGGTVQSIVFRATDPAGIKANSLSLWYSTDNGLTYPNHPVTGASAVSPYSWTLPSDVSTPDVKVRLTLQDNSSYQNVGTGDCASKFTIDSTPPLVTVFQPTAGANLNAGSNYEVKWIVTEECDMAADPITIRYSTDSGASWTLVVSHEADDGTYSWTAPEATTQTARASVEAQNAVGLIGTAATADFRINTLKGPFYNGGGKGFGRKQ